MLNSEDSTNETLAHANEAWTNFGCTLADACYYYEHLDEGDYISGAYEDDFEDFVDEVCEPVFGGEELGLGGVERRS